MFTVAIAWPATETELARLKSYFKTECLMVAPKSYAIGDLVAITPDADAIVGAYIPQEMIDNAPKCKMVQFMSSGVTHMSVDGSDTGFSFPSLTSRNILLGNVAGANAVGVAEHTFALMMTLAKRIIPAHLAISSGEWYPFEESTLSSELAGKTLGILGLGAIGVELVKRAKAFEMRIIANKKSPAPHLVEELGLDFLGRPEDLTTVMRDADFVVVALPWMPATDELIGEAELALMKRTAYLVNIARAAIINETALYEALKDRRIAGFGTDVWWQYDRKLRSTEPVKREVSEWGDPDGHWRSRMNIGTCAPAISRSGIHKLDNVVLTGEKASWGAETMENLPIAAMENVSMLAMGQTPKHLVDLSMY